MLADIPVTGADKTTFETTLNEFLKASNCKCWGVAIAYVTLYGVSFLSRAAKNLGLSEVRLVTDVTDAITHPKALKLASDENWKVRCVKRGAGTFHPKVVVGGTSFSKTGEIITPRALIIGSANLTRGGLRTNVECSLAFIHETGIPRSSEAFVKLWELGHDLNNGLLKDYEIYFAERNRSRSTRELIDLEIADEEKPETPAPSMDSEVAVAAWAGLQSFTGDYTLQIEFPRDAGDVLKRLLKKEGELRFLFSDGQFRPMKFSYYEQNSMFRLNVPNDAPGVTEARRTKSGIALVSVKDANENIFEFKIVPEGLDSQEVMDRSFALGTWGKTTTRYYGWY